jgi:catechol 2,3-dioxygenase-like lactoylglutathione lyase family enzyme
VLGNTPIIACVATAHPEVARRFYRETLGLPLIREDQFALTFDADGTTLRVQIVEAFTPQPFTALGWVVGDIAEAVNDLVARGVRFHRYGFMKQDDLGIWSAPSGARVAWFPDPDGNTLSLTQF